MKTLEIKGGNEVSVKTTPGKGQLNTRDWLLGLLMAVGTPVLTYLYDVLMAFLNYQPVEFDWRTMVKYGIGAGVMYIGKNALDKSKIIIDPKALAEAKE